MALSSWIDGLDALREQNKQQELAELRQWALGQRAEPLTPSLKARWLGMVAEYDGIEAAARTMDRLATQNMPEAMQ